MDALLDEAVALMRGGAGSPPSRAEAIATINEALKLDPYYCPALLLAAKAHRDCGPEDTARFPKANGFYTRALAAAKACGACRRNKKYTHTLRRTP